MTSQERIESLHKRMEDMKVARERRKTAALGATGVMLSLWLILLVFGGGGMRFNGAGGTYGGTSMLLEGAGGYVLVAVVAFFAGVVLTTVLRRHRETGGKEGHGGTNA